MQANGETQNLKSLKDLFDENKLSLKLFDAIYFLEGCQNVDGGFAWMKNGYSSLYQTLYVLKRFSQLTEINSEDFSQQVKKMQINALNMCEKKMIERFKEFNENKTLKNFTPSYFDIL